MVFGCTARFAAPKATDNAPDYVYTWLDTGFRARTMSLLERGSFEREVSRTSCGSLNMTIARDHPIIHTNTLLNDLRRLCVLGGGEVLLFEPKKIKNGPVRATNDMRPYFAGTDESGYHYTLICAVQKPGTETEGQLRFVAKIDSVSVQFVGGNTFSRHKHDVLVAESPDGVDQASLQKIAHAGGNYYASVSHVVHSLGGSCAGKAVPRDD